MSNALYLPDWTVQKVVTGAAYVVEAKYDIEPEACLKCGVVGHLYRHGVKVTPFRDAPVHGKPTTISVRRPRYRCRSCGGTFMQQLPDMDDNRQMTRRCVEFIEQQGLYRTYAQIAEDVGINEKTVRQICNDRFDQAMRDYKPTAPSVLGIDELTLGHERRAIFVDGLSRNVIDLLEGMSREAIERWLFLLPGKESIQVVTMDMWDAYRRVVRNLLPQAIIIVDKWHVQRQANDALGNVRSRLRRSAKVKRRNPWANVRLLNARGDRLTPKRRFILDGILQNDPVLSRAWHAKEAFYAIWDCETRQDAEEAFTAWKATLGGDLTDFDKLAKTVEAWREEVFAYFDHPWRQGNFTNAFTEASNGLIKIANRAGRGYSFKTIRAKAILAQTPLETATCEVCGGTYPERLMFFTHSGGGERVPCPLCQRFHTDQWFKRHSRSTSESG